MDTNNKERRTIKIKLKTYNKLKSKGIYGETMDDIINKLLFQEKYKIKETSNKVANKV